MKAAIINKFGTPNVFETKDVNVPEIDTNEVLIKVHAAGINPVDWKHRYGNHKFILGSPFPIILGYDASGVIESIGSNVKRIKVGDKVFCRVSRKYGGTYAEYVATKESTVSLMPKNIDFIHSAGVPLAALTALQGLRDCGNISIGKDVLIIGGSSGVGHFAVQLVNHFQANCTVVSGSGHEKLFKKIKPANIINYKETDFKKSNQKYDIIYDIIGKESYLTCKHLLKDNGAYISTLPRPKILWHKVISLFSKKHKVRSLLMKANYKDLDYICQLIKNEEFICHVDKIFSLEEAKEAHNYSETGKAEGKIILKICD